MEILLSAAVFAGLLIVLQRVSRWVAQNGDLLGNAESKQRLAVALMRNHV
ncbi:hypothetical protein [Alkalilimnicola ehrlichii]|nr:hypothetical protein [Alkalilimnicola ehrlichii]